MEVIQFYADVNNDINIDDDDDDQVLASKDDYTFIDDSEQNGNNVDFYRGFKNVTRDLYERIDNHEDYLIKRDLQHEKDRNERLTMLRLEIKNSRQKCSSVKKAQKIQSITLLSLKWAKKIIALLMKMKFKKESALTLNKSKQKKQNKRRPKA